MKSLFCFFLVPMTLCADNLITFSAINPVTYEQVTLDSIRVQNVTRGRDTMLVGVTAFALDAWTSVAEIESAPGHFFLSSNYPNGFERMTSFSVAVGRTGLLNVEIYNILGQRILAHSQILTQGWHAFSLQADALVNGVYFLRAATETEQQIVKMLKIGSVLHDSFKINYLGAGRHPGPLTLHKPMQTDLYRFTAFASGFENSVVEKNISGNETMQFELIPIRPPDDFTSRWRGFNLTGFFAVEWSHDGFYEKDFQLINEFGFNFVRLPIDYRIYTKPGDWSTFLAAELAQIDQAVAWGYKYGIHVCINLHRAPGYCINPPSTALPANQNVSLWDNAGARQAFAGHWRMFAERYKNISGTAISFNLVNEPYNVSADAYSAAVLPAIQAIREVTPQRIIISDALDAGNDRLAALLGSDVVLSPHFYNPVTITHYKAEWVNGSDTWPQPNWPPFMVSGYFYGSGKKPWNTPLRIQGDFPAGTVVTLHVGQVSARADFRVTAGTQTIYKHDFRPAAGAGEWKQVIYRPEWNIYQNIYDRDYAFTLTSHAGELTLNVLDGDWMTWSELRFVPPQGSAMVPVSIQPGISDWGVPQAGYALQNDGSLILIKAPTGFEDKFRINGFLQQWVDLKKSGAVVHVGEWGVYNKTPHDVTLAFMENRLLAMKSAGLGWALWNFRGSFGILDSERPDVQYENFRGHKLDRKMLELLQRY